MEMSSTPSSPVRLSPKQPMLPTPSPPRDPQPEQKRPDTPPGSPPRLSHPTDSPHPTWGTPALQWENTSWDKANASRPKSPVSSTASSRGNASPVVIPGLTEPVPLPPISTSEETLLNGPEPTKNEAATPVLPQSPIPSHEVQRTPPRDPKQEEQVPRIPSQGVSSEHSRSPSTKQHESHSWERPELPNRPYFPPRGKHKDRTQRHPVSTANDVQYRGMFEGGGSRNGWGDTSISATDSWGGPAASDAPPEFEGYRTRGRPNGRGVSDQGGSSKNPSRPGLRSLVNLSSGPIDNPLGIRPASPPRKIRIPPRSALRRGKDEAKKGVVIGSDWPKNKSNGGGPPSPRFPEDSPIMDHLPQRRRKWRGYRAPSRSLTVSVAGSGASNGKQPPNFAQGHTIKATVQDAPNGKLVTREPTLRSN